MDSELRDKERLEDVLAGRLPPSVLENQGIADKNTPSTTDDAIKGGVY